MDPFAHKKTKSPNKRKLALLGLAAASFSIWHFDLIPELGSVPTGSLDSVGTDNGLNEADFIAMLEATPATDTDSGLDLTINENEPHLPPLDQDPLIAALAEQTEPMDGVIPAFAESSGESQSAATGIQPASFELSEPPVANIAAMPTVLSPEVAEQLKEVDRWIETGETLEAHAALSRIYWKQPEVRAHIQQRIERTAAEIYASPSTHFAEPYMVEFGDTLQGIANKYNVPWQYLARLNRTNEKSLQAGQKLKVLTGPFGAVIDLDKFEMTVHAHGWFVRRYRIGIGADKGTPVGEFTVQDKLENPKWYNPDGGTVSADDPSNPLGEYWLGLGDHIGIHGTIDPDSIGKAASRGCIHLADGDIAEVFQLLGEGSPVVIRN
ncbi:L,D-transpeptidase family protein [Fuerstiella marisgermanici]|uniref:L,D-transpeptidase YkuD n=1 Tax=Fuerstiella marisgermanici TaxID=1891926 RepID=A0A1P8WL85_9PLAN|nr:L,D-transpeptidase family protein [Fuerstiella marisgermanici]APZ94807.1 Putative L,D-transpeptidase YkuD [Fuerstiella marisgermanici]